MHAGETEQTAAILHALGCRLDDQLEAAQAELHRCEGAAAGLKQTWEKMQGLLGHIDKDIDAGELDLDQAGIAKKHVTRCLHLIEHMLTMAESQLLQARGAVTQANRAVKMIESEYAQSQARVPSRSKEPIGEDARPRRSLKERRLTEHPPTEAAQTPESSQKSQASRKPRGSKVAAHAKNT